MTCNAANLGKWNRGHTKICKDLQSDLIELPKNTYQSHEFYLIKNYRAAASYESDIRVKDAKENLVQLTITQTYGKDSSIILHFKPQHCLIVQDGDNDAFITGRLKGQKFVQLLKSKAAERSRNTIWTDTYRKTNTVTDWHFELCNWKVKLYRTKLTGDVYEFETP